MKKLLSVFLILSVFLGLIACGGPSENDGTVDVDQTETQETEQGFETAGPNGDSETDEPFYAAGSPAATVSINTDAAYVMDDDQSLKVVTTNAKGGAGVLDVLEVFMTPRNVGKTYKITAYVMPVGDNAAFRLSVSKAGAEETAAVSYHFGLKANEWNKLTLCYQVTQENIDAGLVTVKIDQNVSGAVNAPAAEVADTFYVDEVKASLFKDYSPEYAVYKTEDFENADTSFSQYSASTYADLTNAANEYKMGGNYANSDLKVGAWNWKSHSGEKSMTLYNFNPNGSGSFGARVKLNNLLPNELTPYIGYTFKISAYVLMEGFLDPTQPVNSSFGFMGDKKTNHLVYETYSIPEGEWTLIEFEFEITEDFLSMAELTFDDTNIKEHYPVRPFISFGSNSSNFPKTVYIDDFTVEYAMLNTDIGVELPSIFADNMVLQRGKKVPVWGWDGTPGDTIIATVGEYSASAIVDENGEFYLELPEMQGATEQILTVKNGNAGVSFENVGIGEVWYCSGQSNMELKLSDIFDIDEIVANANNYDVRSFKVGVTAKYELQKDVTNGKWSQITKSNVKSVTAIGYIAAYQIQKELGVPVALIECYEGGSAAQAWLSYEKLFAEDRADAYNNKEWIPAVKNNWGCEGRTIWEDYDYYWSIGELYATAKSEGTLIDGTEGSTGKRFAPTGLYNAMQGPLANYAIAGVMWYQGESQPNARVSEQYNYILNDLIEQWREDFSDDDLPVMLVQLAPYGSDANRSFFGIRQVQLDTHKRLENVGVICTAYEGAIDNTDPNGNPIHPGTKIPVGDRMADTIMAMVYGAEEEYCGPEYEYMEIDGNKAILHFSHIGEGLKIKDGDTKLTGFKISADGTKFVDATAQIVGDTVVVTASSVSAPVAVQYAYVNMIDVKGAPDTLGGNLENSISQPAFPFLATMGDAEVHGASVVDGKVNVEIWERGHNETSYQVTVKVNGTTKEYTASFETAGNCIIETEISAKSGADVTVTVKDSAGNVIDTKTVAATAE